MLSIDRDHISVTNIARLFIYAIAVLLKVVFVVITLSDHSSIAMAFLFQSLLVFTSKGVHHVNVHRIVLHR